MASHFSLMWEKNSITDGFLPSQKKTEMTKAIKKEELSQTQAEDSWYVSMHS